jgi:hypothetical protein
LTVRGLVPLLALSLVLTACTNPKDPRLRARDNRAFSALEAAVRRETSARIRDVDCFDVHGNSRVCRVRFHRGRPAELWRLVYTYDSARVRRLR